METNITERADKLISPFTRIDFKLILYFKAVVHGFSITMIIST